MSPRRRVETTAPIGDVPPSRRRYGLPIASAIAATIAATAVAVCLAILLQHVTGQRARVHDAAAVSYVRSFMTQFSSPDPLHANAYTDRILAQATGDFADQYRMNQNEILTGIAKSEPTTGTVLDAGVSRRNDDGSVEVLVVTTLASASPDGTLKVQRANRWVVTTRQEGDQWKISSLIPTI